MNIKTTKKSIQITEFINYFTQNIIIVLLFIVIYSNIEAQPIAEGKSKFLGSAYSSSQSNNFEKYWNQITPENGGKWGSVESSRDNMNWGEAEIAYNFAKNNGFKFRYHILVWGNQQPGWIESLDSTEQIEEIEEWFAAVAAQFPDIDYLEIVNEPLHDPPDEGDGGYINALGGSNSLYGTGWDWIIKAFELGRQYFPDSTKLMINDFNIINSSSSTLNYLEIINLLQERGLIDGIGVQAHAFTTRGTSVTTLKSNLDALGATGLPIQICEMDVDGVDDDVQLNELKRIFPTLWDHESVEGITMWGWRHGLWRESEGAYLVDDRGAPRPALEWMRNYVKNPPPLIPTILSPSNERGVVRNPLLNWSSVDSVTSYRVQLSANSIFSIIVRDTIVTDTTLQIDFLLNTNFRYYWRVSSLNEFNESSFSPIAYFVTGDQITDINENNSIVSGYKLYQNYPNPFNPATTIEFKIPTRSFVNLILYDQLGRIVERIVSGYFSKGNHKITYSAKNLSSGIYFYKINVGNYSESKKISIMK